MPRILNPLLFKLATLKLATLKPATLKPTTLAFKVKKKKFI